MDQHKDRIEEILEVLLDYTTQDYSRKISVSEAGDELDAIAVGINTIGEEIAQHIEVSAEHEAELKEAYEDLKEQQEELESFSYSVSHDLRAPLRAIVGFSQILMKKEYDTLSPNGRRYLNNINENALKMGQLIDDILAFSRLGRQSMSESEFNLKNLINEVYKELTKQNLSNPEIEFTIDELPTIKGDYNLLRQVAVNLLSNAIKYSSKKNLIIIHVGRVYLKNVETFFIRDNGVGFDMKYYHKLFGVFQRLHKDSEFEGNGVGLALCKRILERHNGRIWAESKQGEGTTFYFTINEKLQTEK